MTKPEDVIRKKKEKIQKSLATYTSSVSFKEIVEKSLVDFVKRVKRGYLPELSAIPKLSEEYVEQRRRYKANLGELAKVSKSNATATGQMLEAMTYKIIQDGFILYVASSSRRGELSGGKSKINNNDVAKYYSKDRPIFDFSDPELQRIIRTIKKDLIALIKL